MFPPFLIPSNLTHVQKLLKQAAETTSKVMSAFLIPAVETVIDEGTQVRFSWFGALLTVFQKSHSALAEEMEEIFTQPEKINPKVNTFPLRLL